MNTDTYKEIMNLTRMTVGELREKYLEVFGEETRSHHKDFLRKRIAWRLQALAEGDLSERARRRAEELADDADLRQIGRTADLDVPKACPKGASQGWRASIRAPRARHKSGSAEEQDRSVRGRLPTSRDRRLPLPGTLLVREYKGQSVVVKVLDEGFEYEGRRYKSLSAIAREVTGTKWNGFLFFGLASGGAPASGKAEKCRRRTE